MISCDHQITVFTTPKKLREIAGEMERKMPNLSLGSSTVFHVWSGDGVTLLLSADQDAFRNSRGRNTWA